ncbi:MAG TPA: Rrf2 family transcriptional regulator [Acidimicrobiales bacterium]|jgi:Rrf2 family protein|nr:Rrf2 family transcriptional regulator [Acidimicrobiales bacterium]
MRISAKVDYAVRATIELASADRLAPLKGERIASEQDIPMKFLENILSELRRAGLVGSRRGAEGGYWLARPSSSITIADIIRAVEGPLANVQGVRPEALEFEGRAQPLQRMWICVRASLRGVLEHVTIADLVAGVLPRKVDRLADDPDAWNPR